MDETQVLDIGHKLGNWERLALKDKFDLIENILHFPSLTVMVFARRKLGYRMLSPTYLFLTAFLLILVQNVSSPLYVVTETTIAPYPLTLYVVAVIVWAYVQRWLRWRDLRNGVRWHTYSRGVSYFAFLPLREDIIARFVDPAVCMLIGVLAWWLISHALGLWLMVASLAFLVGELRFYDLVLAQALDVLDGLVESRVSGDFMRTARSSSSPGSSAPTQRRIDETAGIPTGVGDDLLAAVEQRRAESGAPMAAIAS